MSDPVPQPQPFISSERRSEILAKLAAAAESLKPAMTTEEVAALASEFATKYGLGGQPGILKAKEIKKELVKENKELHKEVLKEFKDHTKDIVKEKELAKEYKENKEHKESKETKESKESEGDQRGQGAQGRQGKQRGQGE